MRTDAMVLFFANKSAELLKTKLMKLLNYSDMIFYKDMNKTAWCKANGISAKTFSTGSVFSETKHTLSRNSILRNQQCKHSARI